jgi:hypothetical protein
LRTEVLLHRRGVAVAAGATLAGHGAVSSISGAGTIAPGNSPGILTATHLDPSGGMDFAFDFTQAGSPTYSNAAADRSFRHEDVLPLSIDVKPGCLKSFDRPQMIYAGKFWH